MNQNRTKSVRFENVKDDSIFPDISHFLPDCHVFRGLSLRIEVPDDFHLLIRQVIRVSPLLRSISYYQGKIYGPFLREITWLSFQSISQSERINRLNNLLKQELIQIWVSSKIYTKIWELLHSLGGQIKIWQRDIINYHLNGIQYQIRLSKKLSEPVGITVDSLILCLYRTHEYKLTIQGSDNTLPNTLDDIRKKRLHLIFPNQENEAFDLLVRAGFLYSRGWKPLNNEDVEHLNHLFFSASQIISDTDHLNYQESNLVSPEIYRLLLRVDPDLVQVSQHQNSNQIKAYYLIMIANSDTDQLTKLFEITQQPTVYFAFKTAAELASVEIFNFIYRKFTRHIKHRFLQECLIIAIYHRNMEVAEHLAQRIGIYLPKRLQNYKQLGSFNLELKPCWHQYRFESPCSHRRSHQMTTTNKAQNKNYQIKQILADYHHLVGMTFG